MNRNGSATKVTYTGPANLSASASYLPNGAGVAVTIDGVTTNYPPGTVVYFRQEGISIAPGLMATAEGATADGIGVFGTGQAAWMPRINTA